jgi:hypothetical protein
MKRTFRVARSCALEALRDFHWHEYAPFGWMLAAQLLFLVLAMNLGTVVGMATAGGLSRLVGAEQQLHYPRFFLFLPNLVSIVEAFLYTIPGSILIPLSLIRVLAPMEHASAKGRNVLHRVRRAILPTLIAFLAAVGLLLGWQWVLSAWLGPAIQGAIPIQGTATVWGVSILGAYLISAVFLYVPIAAISPDSRPGAALADGFREGLSLIGFSLFFILAFSWPALPLLMFVQLGASFISDKLRPEVIGILLGLYAAIVSVASYFTYAAAARLHWAAQVNEA